jgi:predicted metal-binding membrane protein
MTDTVSRDPSRSLLGRALQRRSLQIWIPLALLLLVSWAWIVVMARDMYGAMDGASAWMMTMQWDWPHLFLLWAMWAVMMTAMMLPSAAPVLLLYAGAARQQSRSTSPYGVQSFALGYLVVWSLFSLAATVLQRALANLSLVSPMMEIANPVAGGVLLIAAGLYQFTPLKRACLNACLSPIGFLMRRWRSGAMGAFRMGVEHGAYCVGCCWALMLLLFVGGVMNLAVIAALTAFVAFEKLGPFGQAGARVSGVLLVAAGLWMLVR